MSAYRKFSDTRQAAPPSNPAKAPNAILRVIGALGGVEAQSCDSAPEVAALERVGAWGQAEEERTATIDHSKVLQAWGNHDRPLADHDIAEPLRVTDGRRMHRFRAGAIVETVSPRARELLDQARQFGAVLVADGSELHVVAPKLSQLTPELLGQLRIAAGAVIAALRGEHRARTQTGTQDPGSCREQIDLCDPLRGTGDCRGAGRPPIHQLEQPD